MINADVHFGHRQRAANARLTTLQFVQIAFCILQSARWAIKVYSIAALCCEFPFVHYAIEKTVVRGLFSINLIHGDQEISCAKNLGYPKVAASCPEGRPTMLAA